MEIPDLPEPPELKVPVGSPELRNHSQKNKEIILTQNKNLDTSNSIIDLDGIINSSEDKMNNEAKIIIKSVEKIDKELKNDSASENQLEKSKNNNLNISIDNNLNTLNTEEFSLFRARKDEKKKTMRVDSQHLIGKLFSSGIATRLPIDKLSLMVDNEKEAYLSQIFDFKFESDCNWLFISLQLDLFKSVFQSEISIYKNPEEIPYKWELKEIYKAGEDSCFFGKIYEAINLNDNLRYSLKVIEYEELDLSILHDFIYNALILKHLTQYYSLNNVVKVIDLYVTQQPNILEGLNRHVLVVVLEYCPMTLAQIIKLRKEKQLKWRDEEMAFYLTQFINETDKIYKELGVLCDPTPENIFYSGTEDCLKIANFRSRTPGKLEEFSWSTYMKTLYNTILCMKTLTILNSGLLFRKNMKVDIENNESNEKSKVLTDILTNKPDSKDVLNQLKSEPMKKGNEHLIYEIFYVSEKKDNPKNLIRNFSFFSKKYELLLQYTNSLDSYEKMLRYRPEESSLDSKAYLKVKYYIGHLLFQQGLFKESKQKIEEVSNERSKKCPEELGLAIDSLILFAMIDKQNQESEQAIKHLESALNLLRKNGLLSNLKTSQVLVYLGFLYDFYGLNLSHIKKAHRYYTEALRIRRDLLKNKYQNNLVKILNSLGIVNQKLEKHEEALNCFQEVLNIENMSENNLRVANAKMNIGVIHKFLGNEEEALYFLDEAVKLYKNAENYENSEYANILCNIATIQQSQGKYNECIKNYKDALKIKEKLSNINEEESRNVEVILNNLATIYYKSGFFDKAKQFLLRALNLKRNLFGIDNPSVALTLNNLGLVYEKLGQDVDALKNYEESLTIKKKYLSEKHFSLSLTLTNLMYLCARLGYLSSAIDYGRQAFEIKKNSPTKDYINLSAIANYLAALLEIDKKIVEAADYYNEALVFQKMVNETSNEIAIILQKLGEINEMLNENEKSIKYLEDCLSIFIKNLGPIDKSLGEVMCKLADVYHKLKFDDIAKGFYEGTLKLFHLLGNIEPELIENIEDQIKKLKGNKTNKVAIVNKSIKLLQEVEEIIKNGIKITPEEVEDQEQNL